MTSPGSHQRRETKARRWKSGLLTLSLCACVGCANGLPKDDSLIRHAETFNTDTKAPQQPQAISSESSAAELPELNRDPQQVSWEEAAIGEPETAFSPSGQASQAAGQSVPPMSEEAASFVGSGIDPLDDGDSGEQEPSGGDASQTIQRAAWNAPEDRPLPIRNPQPLGVADNEEIDAEAQVEDLEGPQRQTLPFPLSADDNTGPVELTVRDDRLTIRAVDASLDGLLGMIAEEQGLNIISGDMIDERITVTLKDVGLHDALDTILAVKGFTWSQQNNIVVVSKLGGESGSAVLQGREVRVYNLNYVSADDIQTVVTGLLSPAGQVFINQMNDTDQRQTHEQLIVEDLPRYLARVETYLTQADIVPKQVLVEAHVLQVELKDDLRHGINFNQMLRIANSEVSLESSGFASEQAPTTMLRIHGHDLKGLIEAIKTNTNAKTLASPKVAVLNGQQAKMQVGGQIGYLLTTTTQTSTMQSVDFLDVGVMLTVTPIITEDHQILLQVKPEVSTGRINPTTQLPESETTQVETKVMLADGEAIIIGGLIQETDTESESKVPWLGDIRGIGRIFQKRETKRERSEIIIALIPRIISAVPGCRAVDLEEIQRATTPLLHGPLHPNNRRMWEPELPSAKLP